MELGWSLKVPVASIRENEIFIGRRRAVVFRSAAVPLRRRRTRRTTTSPNERRAHADGKYESEVGDLDALVRGILKQFRVREGVNCLHEGAHGHAVSGAAWRKEKRG